MTFRDPFSLGFVTVVVLAALFSPFITFAAPCVRSPGAPAYNPFLSPETTFLRFLR